MTKSQLIERISEKAPHVPRREVERIVNTVFDAMVAALKREDRIEIRGFGSFAVKIREARDARNPKTGEKVHVPRRLTPYFTVGKELRDRLNHQRGEPDSEITDPRGEPARAEGAASSTPTSTSTSDEVDATPLVAAPSASPSPRTHANDEAPGQAAAFAH